MKRYDIFVTNKEGIFDPAGETSKKALANLGYTGIVDVSIGKFIQVEVEDSVPRAQVEEMCEKLLANPVIEDYEIKE
ncbi:MAG: phosphoribosylformylglycinamidine synthase subunit PurS [Eggerthellaceae bacterium]